MGCLNHLFGGEYKEVFFFYVNKTGGVLVDQDSLLCRNAELREEQEGS